MAKPEPAPDKPSPSVSGLPTVTIQVKGMT
jgi:hypothetical protein